MKKQNLFFLILILFVSSSFILSSCKSDEGAGAGGGVAQPEKGRYLVDSNVEGASFVTAEDMNNDGFKDIIVSTYGYYTNSDPAIFLGEVIIYYHDGKEDITHDSVWEKEVVLSTGNNICIANKLIIKDIDNDGDKDIFVPSGFMLCGMFSSPGEYGIAWFENDTTWIQHDILMEGNGADTLFYKGLNLADFDDDGRLDILAIGGRVTNILTMESYTKTYIFKGNDTSLRFDTVGIHLFDGGGTVPELYDVDGDDDLDIISPQFFSWEEGDTGDNASFMWFQNTDGKGTSWTKHAINDEDYGPSIQLSVVENLIAGDTGTYLVGANHTDKSKCGDAHAKESMILFKIPNTDLTSHWPDERVISDTMSTEPGAMVCGSKGSPGVFHWGDVDGDSDLDIVVSGDGDARIFILEQTSTGEFTTNILNTRREVGQAGVYVTDLNGDGTDEIIVSSYDGRSVAIYKYPETIEE